MISVLKLSFYLLENVRTSGQKKHEKRHFLVVLVPKLSLDTKKVQEYIRGQEKEDMMQDNLSNKEYKDPFKG